MIFWNSLKNACVQGSSILLRRVSAWPRSGFFFASVPRPKVLPLPLPRSCAAPAFWNQSTCSRTKCTCMQGGSATLKIIMEMLKMALQIPRLNGRASVGDMWPLMGSPVPRSRFGIKIVVAIAVIIVVASACGGASLSLQSSSPSPW